MSGEVIRLPKGASVPVTLKVLEYELFHFCPLKVSLLISLFLFLQGRLCLMLWLLVIGNDMMSLWFQEIASNISFAPIGLLDMFNSTGAVEQFDIHVASDTKPELFDGEISSELTSSLSDNRSPTATVSLKVRGCGRFGAYSSQCPLRCTVDNVESDFIYDSATGLVTLAVPVPQEEMYRWHVEIQV